MKLHARNSKAGSHSKEPEEIRRQLHEKIKKDADLHEILERVNEGKTNSERGYFVSPNAPKKSRWQSAT